MKHSNISIFIPHLGCPFNCIFCDQFKITGSDKTVTPSDVFNILSDSLKYTNDKKNTQIAFFGGSFTAIDKKLMIEFLEVANKFIGPEMYESIRISTRPDCIDTDILNILKKYNVKTIELGIQSLDDEVLKSAKRGHTASQSLSACKLIQQNGFELGMQMMCGLPGDTVQKDILTAQKIIDLECKQVRIYPVVVIDGTYLAKMYKCGEYKPLTTEEAVSICAKLYKMFTENGVTVLKIGLHSDSNSIAGPFHPAFGELVRSEVFYNTVISEISMQDRIVIRVSNKFTSVAKGNSKRNLTRFEKKGYDVKIVTDNTLKTNYIIEKN